MKKIKGRKPAKQGKTVLDKETTPREIPRIRTIKPELFVHLGLFDAEREYGLPLWQAFAGLILCADREGRFRWQPRRLKLYTIPYHEVDMEQVMDALAEKGFILKYQHQGGWYGCIPSFLSHQKVSQHEVASILPGPEKSNLFQTKNIDVESSELKRETDFVCQHVDHINKIFVCEDENQNKKNENLLLKNESQNLNFYERSIEPSSLKKSSESLQRNSMESTSENLNENNEIKADLGMKNKTDFLRQLLDRVNKTSDQKNEDQDKKNEDLGLKIEKINPNFQKLSTDILSLDANFIFEKGDQFNQKTDPKHENHDEKNEALELKNETADLYFYQAEIGPPWFESSRPSLHSDLIHPLPEKLNKNNRLQAALRPNDEVNFIDEAVDPAKEIVVKKSDNWDEKNEALRSKIKKIDPNFQKLSTGISSMNVNFLHEGSDHLSESSDQKHENLDKKNENLDLKMGLINRDFGKPLMDPLFLQQSEPLLHPSPSKELLENPNKNKELYVDSEAIKSKDFKEKNFKSNCAQGKEGKGMERNGRERNGNEGNGSERKGREGGARFVASLTRPRSGSIPIQEIFEYWKRVMQHPHAKLDPKRRKLISKAFSLGYQMEDLCQAIEGCSRTPHNIGDNDRGQRYDGLHVIFRDADQIERFIHHALHPPRPVRAGDRLTQGNIYAAQSWMEKKMREGSHDAS